VIFGHRDFGKIAEAIEKKRPYAMMTGLMPSGRMHFGHKMVADEIIWFQRHGARTFVCAADVESYLMRDMPFEKAREIALTEYLTNYIALGLSPKNLTFWFQSDYRNEYYRLRDMAAKRVTFNELTAIYGELSTGKIVSVLSQVADILHPQLPELSGPKPVVVPVGVDQDPHIRLTRDIATRLNAERDGGREFACIPPSSTYHKFMQGLSGGKMSSSDPKSFIALSEEPAAARKKVVSAKTGGRETVEEQKKKGGEPEKCMIFELYKYHLIEDDKKLKEIYENCKSGKLLCGEDKKNCADLVEKFLVDHAKKREKAKDKMGEYVSGGR
jgi:tryptophanyl-tRNA synthetase